MANYKRPDTYVEDKNSKGSSPKANGSLIPIFIGVCNRGKVGQPFLVQNFTEFKKTQEHSDIYLPNSDLAYSLKGYYDNTSTPVWIIRVANTSAKCATIVVPTESGATFTAVDEGTWANGFDITVSANEEVSELFDIKIGRGSEIYEQFTKVSKTPTDENFFVEVINNKSKIVRAQATGTLAVGTGKLATGNDGTSSLNDTDYNNAIDLIDLVPFARLLVVPGQSSENVIKKMLEYCTLNRPEIFPILDMPLLVNVTTALELRKKLNGKGATYYSWLSMLDPASSVGKNRIVPNSGHVAGVYSRIINAKGASENPAGTEAQIMGINGLYNPASMSEMELLNPEHINSIREVENEGICVWGVRTLSTDDKFKYVSDCILDAQIKKDVKEGMMWAVFKGNVASLHRDITNNVRTYMLGLMRNNLFASDVEEEAFYVKCDDELNTDIEKDNGMVICEVGYARKRPGEFIVFRIDQRTSL